MPLLVLGGCTPAQTYVAGDRATYAAIAPEYAAYVALDDTLDADAKARRTRTIETWELRLRSAEREFAGRSLPQPLAPQGSATVPSQTDPSGGRSADTAAAPSSDP